ncbi:hypothetical protein [Roseisalinus antarcticus]|uniref:Uncharacterized protein n=1 Tax=Roseisalinus antarcticus TaxID=254357 RepID=A0A1Y5SQT1_9RHOB|nr:hypothetical protein [Roseisalinus antarcticus]SLN46286.1 hypothetical protein ROA7023_01910 [Roseisalinus antarcticus]
MTPTPSLVRLPSLVHLPSLVRLYVRSCLIGFGAAAIFVVLILWADVANLRHLVMSAPGGWLAVGLLWIFNGIVFAGVQFGIAVMAMAEPPSDDSGPPEPVAERLAVPIRITEAPGRAR